MRFSRYCGSQMMVLSMFAAVLWAGSVFAVSCVDYADDMALPEIGRLTEGGWVTGSAAQGNLLIQGRGDDGFRVFDISSPTMPVELSHKNLGARVKDVAIQNAWVYVVMESAGLAIFSLNDPAGPVQTSALSFTGTPYFCRVQGDFLFVTTQDYNSGTYEGALHVIDVFNPTNPILVASYIPDQSVPTAIEIHGQYAFLGTNKRGLEILDISNPVTPQLVSRLNETTSATGSEVRDNLLYYTSNEGLVTADISDIQNPEVLNIHPEFYAGNDVIFHNGYLLVPGTPVWIADLTNPVAPKRIGCQSPDANHPVLVGDVGYFGLDIIDLSHIEGLMPTATLPLPQHIGGMALRGQHAIIKIFSGDPDTCNLLAVNLEEPAAPFVESTFACRMLNDVSINDRGYLAAMADNETNTSRDFVMIDVRNPAQMETIATLPDILDAQWQAPMLNNNIAVVTCVLDIKIIDISDPQHPNVISTIERDWWATPMVLTDTHLYLVNGGKRLLTYDIRLPHNPILKSTLQVDEFLQSGTVYQSSMLYMSCLARGKISCIDVTDPDQPVVAQTLTTRGYVYDIKTSGSALYVVNSNDQGIVFDLSLPQAPEMLGHFPLVGAPGDMVLNEYFLATLDSHVGLTICPLQCSQTTPVNLPVRLNPLTAHPNPFNPNTVLAFNLPEAAVACIEIYDVRGRHVRTLLPSTELSAGPQTYNWNGKSDQGLELPSGVYFAQLTLGPNRHVRKLALLR